MTHHDEEKVVRIPEIGVLQNDPNRGLRDRLEPETEAASRSSRDTLIMALHDLHQVARDRLETAQPPAERRPKRHRLKMR